MKNNKKISTFENNKVNECIIINDDNMDPNNISTDIIDITDDPCNYNDDDINDSDIEIINEKNTKRCSINFDPDDNSEDSDDSDDETDETDDLESESYSESDSDSDNVNNKKIIPQKKLLNNNVSINNACTNVTISNQTNSNMIFRELIKHQLSNVPSQWKLHMNDMKRICKYINTSIFDKKKCCVWNGYITNINNTNKGTYVNFYFRNKKVALHRLLYSNFVAPLDSSEYLKFNCDNKGICCNVNHYEKYKYTKNTNSSKETKQKVQHKEVRDVIIIGSDNKKDLTICFD